MRTIQDELGRTPSELYSEITAEPVAAASLGQVYKAVLKDSGDVVAVKVQRPFVLETVSLDLHLIRQIGLFVRNFPDLSSRLTRAPHPPESAITKALVDKNLMHYMSRFLAP